MNFTRYSEIVEFLRLERYRQRLTQKQIAQRALMTGDTVWRAETGKQDMLATTLFRWIRVLGYQIRLVPVGRSRSA